MKKGFTSSSVGLGPRRWLGQQQTSWDHHPEVISVDTTSEEEDEENNQSHHVGGLGGGHPNTTTTPVLASGNLSSSSSSSSSKRIIHYHPSSITPDVSDPHDDDDHHPDTTTIITTPFIRQHTLPELWMTPYRTTTTTTKTIPIPQTTTTTTSTSSISSAHNNPSSRTSSYNLLSFRPPPPNLLSISNGDGCKNALSNLLVKYQVVMLVDHREVVSTTKGPFWFRTKTLDRKRNNIITTTTTLQRPLVPSTIAPPQGRRCTNHSSSSSTTTTRKTTTTRGFFTSQKEGLVDKIKRHQNTTNKDCAPDILVENRHLNVGDILWVVRRISTGSEWVLDWIVERKTTTDFAASIIDGRYDDQKCRLRQAPAISKVFYLVEKHNPSTRITTTTFKNKNTTKHKPKDYYCCCTSQPRHGTNGNRPFSAVESALLTTQFVSGFSPICSSSATQTARLLCSLHERITVKVMHLLDSVDEPDDTLWSWRPSWKQWDYLTRPHQQDVVVHSGTNGVGTTRTIFYKQLAMLPGCGPESASTLVADFPSMEHLRRALLGQSSDEIFIQNRSRKLSKQLVQLCRRLYAHNDGRTKTP